MVGYDATEALSVIIHLSPMCQTPCPRYQTLVHSVQSFKLNIMDSYNIVSTRRTREGTVQSCGKTGLLRYNPPDSCSQYGQFSVVANAENSFSWFMQKRKVVELEDVISAQINSHIAIILSPKASLCDLQKLSYKSCDNCDIRKRFSRFTLKRKALELNDVISA